MKRTSLTTATACVLCLASAAPAAADYSGNPLAGDNGFGVLIQSDATLGSTETEGSVAIGGNLTYGPGYNVALHAPGTFTAPGDARPTALLVGSRVDYAGSSPQGVLKVLSNGYVKIGDATGSSVLEQDGNTQDTEFADVNTQIVAQGAAHNSTPRIETTVRQPASSVTDTTGLPDLDALFATYRDRSTAIGTCDTSVILRDDAGNPLPDQTGFPAGTSAHVTLTDGETNVLRLTGVQLNNLSEIVFDTPPTATAPFVVDIDTTGTNGTYVWHMPNLAGASGEQAPYMLWNFSDATDITMADGDSLEGTVFAPRAHLTDVNPANIEGTVVARELVAGPLTEGSAADSVNAGEIHQFPFATEIDCGTDQSPSPSPSEPTPSPSEPTPSPSEPTPSSSVTTPAPTYSPSRPGPPSGFGDGHHRPPGGGLADTGTSTTLLAASGALLLVAAGMVLLGRRRRPKH
ncbi:choice-of-anchor A family protein [Streptomyces sp. BE230]|uniref:choice-of-anchor A family protein n=1 Tax=Streptomyces sp. BE230 TaxID=3002526 RepID=UPI002ED23961|nr:choice-of-anchor A family protein [Streptomyces sp. BE230]